MQELSGDKYPLSSYARFMWTAINGARVSTGCGRGFDMDYGYRILIWVLDVTFYEGEKLRILDV